MYPSNIVCDWSLSRPFLHTQSELDKNSISLQNIIWKITDNQNYISTIVSIIMKHNGEQ